MNGMLSRKTTQLFTFAYNYPFSLGSATRQLDELQTTHKEELERTTSRMGVLERELAAAREAKEDLDKVVLGLNKV